MMKRFTFLVSLSLSTAFVPGCAQGGGLPDAGPIGVRDGGPVRDAGRRDAGRSDGGEFVGDSAVPRDAGRVDAGRIDAGGPIGTDAGPCVAVPCRLISPQCGCTAGQGCYPTATGPMCQASGTVPEAGGCGSHNQCAPGMLCDVDQCVRICNTDTDCPERGSQCVNSVTVAGTPVNVCSVPCEPANSAACPGGAACRYINGPRGYYTDCVPSGSSGNLGSCSSDSDCDRNLVCVSIPGVFSGCAASCRVGGPDCSSCESYLDCSFGGDCIEIDGDEYGWCSPF